MEPTTCVAVCSHSMKDRAKEKVPITLKIHDHEADYTKTINMSYPTHSIPLLIVCNLGVKSSEVAALIRANPGFT